MTLPRSARVLVTGGTGFLGAHFLARVAKDDVELHAVNRHGGGPLDGRVTWHAANLLDGAAAAELIKDIRPTHLLHSAWMAAPGRFWTDPSNLGWLEAGVAMMRAFRSGGGERFVGIGTCAEYDWSSTSFIEDQTPIRPATLYGRSKAAMWAAAEAFSHEAFGAAWARVFLPYGPGDSDKRLIRSVTTALRNRAAVSLGSGTHVRDFIWAPDLADLVVTLLASDATGVFNAGTGHGTSVRAVAEYIARRVGRPELLQFGTRPDPVSEPPSLVADTGKVRNVLRWQPKTAVFSGLDELLESG